MRQNKIEQLINVWRSRRTVKKNFALNDRALSCHVTCFWWKKKTRTCDFFSLADPNSSTRLLFFSFSIHVVLMVWIYTSFSVFAIEHYILFRNKNHTPTHTWQQHWLKIKKKKVQKYSQTHTGSLVCTRTLCQFANTLSQNSNNIGDESRSENKNCGVNDFVSMSMDVLEIHSVSDKTSGCVSFCAENRTFWHRIKVTTSNDLVLIKQVFTCIYFVIYLL